MKKSVNARHKREAHKRRFIHSIAFINTLIVPTLAKEFNVDPSSLKIRTQPKEK